MVFRQVMALAGPERVAEMTLMVSVRYDDEGKIECFLVEPGDQSLFDSVVDSVVTGAIASDAEPSPTSGRGS